MTARGTALAAFLLAAAAAAHVRLVNPATGDGLKWPSPQNIRVVLQAAGSDDVPDASDTVALRNAIDEWNALSGTSMRIVEDTSSAEQSRTDWDETDIHLMLFDEDDSSGFFPPGTGTVAITPVWFDSSADIVDADILFNGDAFQFTTTGQGGAFDVQDVAVHELGHLLGLDHTGWAGASMYPYVSPAVVEHRSVSDDEVRGMRHVYPQGSSATITGKVRRALDNTPVAGAHVVARDANGRTAAAALAGGNGNFTLRGLEAGDYTVYASPFDFPVSAANISNGQTVQVDFMSTVGPTVPLSAGGTAAAGDILVGADTTLSLGRHQDRYPLRAIAGQMTAFLVRGAGLDPGCTLSASDPAITITNPNWMSAIVGFDVSVPAGAPRGHADLVVDDGAGHLSILTGALEITPPSPVVVSLSVTQGTTIGGTSTVLSGMNFLPGVRVVIGSRVYVDGASGGCTVVDASTIALTTLATAAGTYDVVVIDPSGEEGRKTNGFQFASLPAIATVFPAAGAALGGTQVVVTGSNFLAGLEVRIDGVTQGQVTLVDPSTLLVTTEPGAAGGPYVLEVENPGGEIATSAYSYSASADPAIAGVSPAKGRTSGGTAVTIQGASFTPGASVVFGADPLTGAGGVSAANVTFVDASTLQVTTPSHAKGKVAVLVRSGAPGQATILDDAFTFTAPGSSGGGGCATEFSSGPFDASTALGSAAPWMLAIAWIAVRALRSCRRVAVAG